MKISLVLLILALAVFWEVECRGRGGGGGRGGGRSGGRSSGGRSGGWFGSSSRNSGGGWFGSKSKGSSGTKSSSYPKQQWGTSSSYPKQPWGRSASPNTIGGGGFVNPKSYGGYGSRTSSFGRSSGYTPTYSYRSPGYGTHFGTRFPGGMGAYGYNGYGFSKKRLGLGVGAGFIGGAMTGMAVMSVYHRYQTYKHMMLMHQYGGGYHDPYYNNYYMQGRCMQSCPYNAHCEYGFCECDYGFTQRNGACYRHGQVPPPRTLDDPFIACNADGNECEGIDINMICDSESSRCACRTDFKWNKEVNECQFHLDVDCSNITYNTNTSTVVEQAANKTLAEIQGSEEIQELAKKDNLTAEEVMQTSMLPNIDPVKASEAEIKEAFCRDIDSFSWEFGEYEDPPSGPSWGQIIGLIALVIIIQACCCYKQRRKITELKDKLKGRRDSNDRQMADVNSIPLTDQQSNNVIQNPGYQPQPTPLHVNLPAESQPLADPAPIPPTQPGYTNVYPPLNNDSSGAPAALPYPVSPNPAPAYAPVPQQPYPPAPGGLPYPAPGGPTPAPAPAYPAYPSSAQPPYNPNA